MRRWAVTERRGSACRWASHLQLWMKLVVAEGSGDRRPPDVKSNSSMEPGSQGLWVDCHFSSLLMPPHLVFTMTQKEGLLSAVTGEVTGTGRPIPVCTGAPEVGTRRGLPGALGPGHCRAQRVCPRPVSLLVTCHMWGLGPAGRAHRLLVCFDSDLRPSFALSTLRQGLG